MAKQRDYKREYETSLEHGDNKRFKTISARLNIDEVDILNNIIERYHCKTFGEFIRKILYDDILK